VDDITTEVHTNDGQEAVDLMQDLVQFTYTFAGAFAWRPNIQKNRRFSADPAVRSTLRGIAGPPVAIDFVDLATV
jgi:hypothetical protein